MLPFKVLTAALPVAEKDKVTIPVSLLNFLLSAAARSAEFDEEEYLRRNPDVAIAVRQGKWSNGKDHYVASGYFEDRAGVGIAISESWYLATNPDVARAVKDGEWQSAQEHYTMRGVFEWRVPKEDLTDDILQWKQAILGSGEHREASVRQKHQP